MIGEEEEEQEEEEKAGRFTGWLIRRQRGGGRAEAKDEDIRWLKEKENSSLFENEQRENEERERGMDKRER